ncbi:MAG: aspartate-semialdehyde dehydrogenase [Tenacibaculum sp.]
MKVAVVGVTGMVGNVMLRVLAERNFPLSELIPVASERSIGSKIVFKTKSYKVVGIETALALKPDIALFSAGASISLEWASQFAAVGSRVIDNSSAWRMNPKIKLIVPEINASILTKNDKIIANPNCSTIQMVMVLATLHKKYSIKRIVVSTYQSVTGTGVKAVDQLENEIHNVEGELAYPYQIHKNALPHCDAFEQDNYTKEELKLVRESHKILNDSSIGISATAVRVPVVGGHSEAVNIEFNNPYELKDIREILSETQGVIVQDSPQNNLYPMPVFAEGKDEVFVGRIRRDLSIKNALNLWIVADNLRKGAATNTVQIAEYLVEQKLVQKKCITT